MITLHIAKLLEDEGFGIIDQDLFWEEMPLDSNGNARDGIWIVSILLSCLSLRETG